MPTKTVVVVTASNETQAAAVEKELRLRHSSGAYGDHGEVLFLTVPDPSSARVGSGGATLNALLTVQELLCGHPGWGLSTVRVFMIHSGGDSQRLPAQSVCGKAWSALPAEDGAGELQAPIDLLLVQLFALFSGVAAGLVVACSDVILRIPPGFLARWPANGVTGLAFPAPKHLGANHGVFMVAPESLLGDEPAPSQAARATVGGGRSRSASASAEEFGIHADAAASDSRSGADACHVVLKFWQKASVPELQAAGAVRPSDDCVLIDTGVVYCSPPAVEALTRLCVTAPLDSCTYLGVDSGRTPLRVELYSDIMLALGGGLGLSREQYLGLPTTAAPAHAAAVRASREVMWAQLTAVPLFATVIEGGGFTHVGTTQEYLQLLTAPTPAQALHGLRRSAAVFPPQPHAQAGDQGGSCKSGSVGLAGPVLLNTLLHTKPMRAPAGSSTDAAARTLGDVASAQPRAPSPGSAAPPASVIEHSELRGDWRVGAGCLVSCVRSLPGLWVRDGIALQEMRVPLTPEEAAAATRLAGCSGDGGDSSAAAGFDVDVGRSSSGRQIRAPCSGRVVTVLGVADGIKDPHSKAGATFCGVPWDAFCSVAGVGIGDIWPAAAGGSDPAARTLWTARLFPVFPDPVEARLPQRVAEAQQRAALWMQWAVLASGSPVASADGALPVPATGAAGVGFGSSAAPAWAAAFAGAAAAYLGGSSPADDVSAIEMWRSAHRLSLRDILNAADASSEFAWRHELRQRVDIASLLHAVAQPAAAAAAGLSNAALLRRLTRGWTPEAHLASAQSSSPALASTVVVPKAQTDKSEAAASGPAFNSADTECIAALASGSGGSPRVHVACRALCGLDAIAASAPADVAGHALAVQSALLWGLAGWGDDVNRSGPAHHGEWEGALRRFEARPAAAALCGAEVESLTRERRAGVAELAVVRERWLRRVHLVGRAARHYERASQLMTAQCVYTAPVNEPLALPAAAQPRLGQWAVAACPARIDLAGGWSDTPPITYEASYAGAAADVKPAASDSAMHASALAAPASSLAWGAAGDAHGLAKLHASAGGLVANVAVRVDGIKPLGCRARVLPVPGGQPAVVVIRTLAAAPRDAAATARGADAVVDAAHGMTEATVTSSATLPVAASAAAPPAAVHTSVIASLSQLADYDQPQAEGAIVKCCLLLLGVLPYPGSEDEAGAGRQAVLQVASHEAGGVPASPIGRLSALLQARLGGSLEVETWSQLPHGSGLGGSSILATAVLAALARVLGLSYDLASLTHLVLKLEQMLSTGGGWQDQVGGAFPGVKLSLCAAALPVAVHVEHLGGSGADFKPAGADAGTASTAASATAASMACGAAAERPSVEPPLASFLDAHLLLVYTGRTRLAKNLLQRVLRQWAVRDAAVTGRVAELRANAADMAAALAARDAAAVGACLSRYWEQKKGMAPGAEPAEVTALLRLLREAGLIHGASLTGAGGGGFMVLVLRHPGPAGQEQVEALLRRHPALQGTGFSVHAATVDEGGLVASLQE